MADVVHAAQRVAGTIAARGRGDIEGARALLTSFEDHEELGSGAMLVAELALGLLSESTGESVDQCVGNLNMRLLSIRA